MKPIRYKNGVVRRGEVYYNGSWHDVTPSPQRFRIEQVMNTVFNELFSFPATVTCIIEGKHSKNSLHPKGMAEDFRTWTTPTSGVQMSQKKKELIKGRASRLLGSDYDVVIEKDHLHVEFDPKYHE